MKNFTLLSIVVLSVLLTACGEKTKKAVEESSEVVQEAVKEDTLNALDEAKKALSDAAEASKVKAAQMAEDAKIHAAKIAVAAEEKTAELKASAQESITEAGDAIKEQAETAKAAASEAIASIAAPDVYAKCTGCHGADGKTMALGKSAVIAGQDKDALITSLHEYRAGMKNVAGMGGLMKAQVASMSDEDFEVIAEYLSSVK